MSRKAVEARGTGAPFVAADLAFAQLAAAVTAQSVS